MSTMTFSPFSTMDGDENPKLSVGGWFVSCLACVFVYAVTFPVTGVVELVELLLRPVAWNPDSNHLRHHWDFIYESHPTWRSWQKWIHGGCMFFLPPSLCLS
jgi:hypothetical protein